MSSNVLMTDPWSSGHSILQENFGAKNNGFLTKVSSENFIVILVEFFSSSVSLFSSFGENVISIV